MERVWLEDQAKEVVHLINWRLVANLGDVNPIDHGGFFVFVNTDPDYDPEVEVLEVDGEDWEDERKWTVYRFSIERCTYIDGVLSDNSFHPDHPAWFADDIESIAKSSGETAEELIGRLCSEDPVERALGYREIYGYWGGGNFDQDPLEFDKRGEVGRRYNAKLKRLARREAAERDSAGCG